MTYSMPAEDVALRERVRQELAQNGSEPDDSFEPEVLSMAATFQLPDPEDAEMLLGDLLVRGGRLVLGGHTGEGKSTMALWMIRAIVRGDRFLGFEGPGGRGLVIDAEQGLRTIKRRLLEVGLQECSDADYMRVPDGLSLDRDERHIAAIERVLTEGRYDVVLADPLYKLHTGDSNDERSAVDLMRRFDSWREQYRFGLILPVHCRKPPAGAKFGMHEFFGSSAYLRGAEVIVGVQRRDNGYSRLHFFKDRDGDLPVGEQWGLLFDREDGFRRDPNDEKRRVTAIERISELLVEEPGLTQKQIVDHTGYAPRTVRDTLAKLPTIDVTGPHGEKAYSLSDGVDQSELEWSDE